MSNNSLNPFEKVLLSCIGGVCKLTEAIDEKFDIDLNEKMNSSDEKAAEFQKEHPILNIGKQLAKGTIRGLLGNYVSNK